ncbi:hypothetical protein DB35_05590 [Streptomyces abyssalis]|uniref:Uncharacterized protein n=1 Tax=Streptomyces abyssalis TaxID=933944 RepID=A0A1E7JTG6_9ACTN|nr:hypothetical protein [Streptomyces abyssalis]OEU92166.1 hypothetical protein AN215_07150 [Streptomyces abyssalis]OEU94553.1 hypothetical protein DB35_05590 [Streptomyces abyssalis]
MGERGCFAQDGYGARFEWGPFVPRLVLPSPNGPAVSATAPDHGGGMVVAASLRNAAAVGLR